ncbi:MAG: hypothetical protein U0903_05225 [Planctomycetales bacterium]
MLRSLLHDETGFIVSLELVLIASIAVIALVVGFNEICVAINTELNDISNAIGALNQSYGVNGYVGSDHYCGKLKSFYAGSRFYDTHDDCDNNQSCDVVIPVNNGGTTTGTTTGTGATANSG